jgi:hypothetical protein
MAKILEEIRSDVLQLARALKASGGKLFGRVAYMVSPDEYKAVASYLSGKSLVQPDSILLFDILIVSKDNL